MRLVRSYDRRCERAREWLSLSLDGELSRFERALVDRHLSTCAECAAFGAELAAFTERVRATPLEPLTHPIAVPGRRTRPALRPAQAAVAALAVVAVGIGTLSSSLREQTGRDRLTQPVGWTVTKDQMRERQLRVNERNVLARQAALSSPVRQPRRQIT
jgi:predicted anti-sigma-YlaC factor YlaD